jgi:hypothetical protein
MEVEFPVLVLERDSGDILKFESVAAMQRYVERIDINNNEYAAWDATGHPVSLRVEEPVWLKLIQASEQVSAPDLSASLKHFARLRKVTLTNAELTLPPLALYDAIIARRR